MPSFSWAAPFIYDVYLVMKSTPHVGVWYQALRSTVMNARLVLDYAVAIPEIKVRKIAEVRAIRLTDGRKKATEWSRRFSTLRAAAACRDAFQRARVLAIAVVDA